MTLQSQTIPNLIQGVSQQAAQQRRDSQCEAQYDCLNSPKNGAVARHGADLIALASGLDLTGAFTYELFRGDSEHYLVAIKGGVVRVFNLNTGAPCTVNIAAGYAGYLVNDGGNPRDNFTVQTVDDYTFIAAKPVAPAMSATLSSTRPKEAIVFFKAGAYLSKYVISLRLGSGSVRRWSYETPDNSTAANAKYIMTSQIAATFYKAMTGSDAPAADSGGIGGVYPGSATGVSGSGFTATELGYSVSINGNILRIWRTDGQDFTIDTADGAGDTHVVAIKDSVRSLSDLPRQGFQGFTVQVRPVVDEDSADYWVEYVSEANAAGIWRERVAPSTKTQINPATMPHALVNLGPNLFELRPLTWSTRIAGDGVDTAKDPGFIGKRIEQLFFHQGRLAILTEATCDWSKARNTFTFFPDTAQALLDDAPIGITLSAADTIALLRKAATVDESLYLWAQGVQFRVHSGNDPFRQDTIEAPPSTAYEFAEQANFAKAGSSLYFATEPDTFATIRNLVFQQGRSMGDTDVTAHVSEYIPAGVRKLSISDTGQMLFVQTDGAPAWLYLYNYLVQDRTVVQSAWNVWRFPGGGGPILWSSVYRLHLYLAIQRGDGVAFLKVPLNPKAVDPGGKYRTRLDMRVTEAQCAITYDAATNRSTITLPYNVYSGDAQPILVVLRTVVDGATSLQRGRTFEVVSTTGRQVVVEGDIRGQQFYAGFRIQSLREESTFYLRGQDGLIPTDRLQLRKFHVNHDNSGYYRIEVDQGQGRKKVEELKPIKLGASQNVLGSPPLLDRGSVAVAVDGENEQTTITLINDSFLPSAWQTAEVHYEAVVRAKPSRIRSN